MKKITLFFAFLISISAYAQDVAGKYKLKFVSYGKDTVSADDTTALKTFAYKVAIGQKPDMEKKDSAMHVGGILFAVTLFRDLTLDFRANGEYWLIGFISGTEGTKNGTYKLKKNVLTVTTNSGKEEVYDLKIKGTNQYINRSKNGLTFIFAKQ